MGFLDRLLGRSPERAFAREVTAVLHRMPGISLVERGRRDLELRVTRTGVAAPDVMTLDNLFREVQGLPYVARRAQITRFVRVVTGELQVPGAWPQVQERVLPAVRPAGFTAGLGGDRMPVTWPLAPFLVETVVVDFEESMGFVGGDSLSEWEVTADAARLAGHENLTRKGIQVAAVAELPGAWVIVGPSSHQSSWLAAHGWLAGAAASQVEGDPLVLAPARDHAIVVGAGEPRVVAAALSWAEAVYGDEARPLSPVAYRLDRPRLEPWEPEPDHPCRPFTDRAARLLAFQEYGTQTEHVQALLDAAGEPIHVGVLALAERDDETVFTWATWAEDDAGTDILLPEADYVAVVGSSGDELWIRWADLRAEAGALLVEEPGWGLARHRATGWPDADLLARLRRHATTP